MGYNIHYHHFNGVGRAQQLLLIVSLCKESIRTVPKYAMGNQIFPGELLLFSIAIRTKNESKI